jgi:hypothetical protein
MYSPGMLTEAALIGGGILTGSYTEVPCSQWSVSDGSPLFNGACISGESAPSWPVVGCGNKVGYVRLVLAHACS